MISDSTLTTTTPRPRTQGPDSTSAQVKGTKITSKLTFLRQEYGEEIVEQVTAALPEEDRARLRVVLDLGWYPQELYGRLLRSIQEVAGDGDPRILERIGYHTAEHQAANAYKVYFKVGDPVKLLEQMVPMHAQLNDPGEMRLERLGDTQVRMVVTAPRSTREGCRVAKAFYRRSLELCGAKQVRVRESHCSARQSDRCEFDIQWS